MRYLTSHPRRTALFGVLAAGSASLLAACGSSSPVGAASAGSGAGSTSPTSVAPASSGGQASGITISSASVPGFGAVLVDSSGRTLYMLSSEQGGKITCTDGNGCTNVWPVAELPQGVTAATAGSGVRASLLGTVKAGSGSLVVTYGGWPLHTYAGDSGPAQAKGEGISSFGGIWYVLSTAGQPVKSSSTNNSTPSSSGGGYNY